MWKWKYLASIMNNRNIKNRNCYSFNDITKIGNFDPNNIKIDENSNKDNITYYIGYETIKEYVKIYSVNPLYLISRHVMEMNV